MTAVLAPSNFQNSATWKDSLNPGLQTYCRIIKGFTLWKHFAATHFFKSGVLSITFKVAEVLVHSFVISRLDALNFFLSGLPKKNFYSSQMVQKAVAHILTGSKKYIITHQY